jgi:hypothetical protein
MCAFTYILLFHRVASRLLEGVHAVAAKTGCFEQRAILTLEETLQRQSSEELEIPESGDVFPKSGDRYFPVE